MAIGMGDIQITEQQNEMTSPNYSLYQSGGQECVFKIPAPPPAGRQTLLHCKDLNILM